MKDIRKTYLELFLNKMLKSGKKYKYFLTIKNLIRLYGFIFNFFVKKKTKIWHPSALSKEQLLKKSCGYTFIKKVIKKKKKFKKVINVSRLDVKQNALKEWFKLISLIVYKLPVRTLELKLFYLSHLINNRNIKKWKMFRKLAALYYKNVKVTRKTIRKVNKRSVIKANNENNINKRLFFKYRRYRQRTIYDSKRKLVKRKKLISRFYSTYWEGKRFIKLPWFRKYWLYKHYDLIKKANKSFENKIKIKSQLNYSNFKIPYHYYIHEINFFQNSFYKFNKFLNKKKFEVTYKNIKRKIHNFKNKWSIKRIDISLSRNETQYAIYKLVPDLFYFSPRVKTFCYRLRCLVKSLGSVSLEKKKRHKIVKYFWKALQNNLFHLNKNYANPENYNDSYIVYNNTFFKVFYTYFKKYVFTLKSKVIKMFFRNKKKAELKAKIEAERQAKENAEEKVLDRIVEEALYGTKYDDGFTGVATPEDIARIEARLIEEVKKDFNLKKLIRLVQNCFNIIIRDISSKNIRNKLGYVYQNKISQKFKKSLKKYYKKRLKKIKENKLIYYVRRYLYKLYTNELVKYSIKSKGTQEELYNNIDKVYKNNFLKSFHLLRKNMVEIYKNTLIEECKKFIYKSHNSMLAPKKYYRRKLSYSGYLKYIKPTRYKGMSGPHESYVRQKLDEWAQKRKAKELAELHKGKSPAEIEEINKNIALKELWDKERKERKERMKRAERQLPELTPLQKHNLKQKWKIYKEAVLYNVERACIKKFKCINKDIYDDELEDELPSSISTLHKNVKETIQKISGENSQYSDEGSERESDCESYNEIDKHGKYIDTSDKAIYNRLAYYGMHVKKRLINGRYYLVHRPSKIKPTPSQIAAEVQLFEHIDRIRESYNNGWQKQAKDLRNPEKLRKILRYMDPRDKTDPRFPPKVPTKLRLKRKPNFGMNWLDDTQRRKK